MKKIIGFCKKDIVSSISFILCFLSCFMVPPSKAYIRIYRFSYSYSSILFNVNSGRVREQYFFSYVADILLKKIHSAKGLVFSLVFLCFISSMFITNDVALITFVPFGILLLNAAGMDSKICLTVVFMSIAANLGSMFTPIGNPQNLYLFSLSQMKLTEFLSLMFPYTLISAILFILFIVVFYKNKEIKVSVYQDKKLKYKNISIYILLFILCLLCVGNILYDWILVCIVAATILLLDYFPIFKSRLFVTAYFSFLFYLYREYKYLGGAA